MKLDTIQARVARGVKLLDKVVPDWRNRINPGTLKIEYGEDCVIGQVYGGFFTGLELVGLKYSKSPNHGFEAFPLRGRTNGEVNDEYNALNAEWRSVLSGNKN